MDRATLIERTKGGPRAGAPRGEATRASPGLLHGEVDKLRALIDGGMSQRKAAEAMGVKESTARLALSL
jgi:hypothetical protein